MKDMAAVEAVKMGAEMYQGTIRGWYSDMKATKRK